MLRRIGVDERGIGATGRHKTSYTEHITWLRGGRGPFNNAGLSQFAMGAFQSAVSVSIVPFSCPHVRSCSQISLKVLRCPLNHSQDSEVLCVN